ncbi:von Willebrand factor type A domain-containing protein [Phaeosphaeria sp. MPI-PUGE-AT-0046c]|nr:von Willebrand factor type A domain-containing protein [Phaeosphaeria sp. MPI-PUGE-AT-0046c]
MSYYHSSGHICGLYYNIPTNYFRTEKVYLPQVELQAHATILSTTSRTVLKQTFLNPSTNKAIREVRYTFPLYDGVSVVGFTCHVGDRTIVGEVKEKEKAKAVFKAAVANGQTAGLFEQLPEASDVFTTTVGNIPPGAKVVVEITYLGELKHDMEVDGIRFTIPNIICPRYGSYRTEFQLNRAAQQALGSGISITIDADMADGSFIQKIQSPTHPISMTMGTTSLAPDAEPTMSKASASLALGTAELEKDFVVQIIAKNTGTPKAVLETHPTIPNHKALMATLVPKFALPPEKPELVFVCDRSGSMGGSNMRLVIQALKVFLKSLPVGVKFNICSFGSSYSFLWPKSVTYSQATLDEANRHAESFDANYGGTEMLQPIKATIEQRYSDMPLDVVLLTDGEIWNQNELFSYLNESVQDSKAPIRVFTLGIGNGVSHALIEGVAKAGNGFSQSVGDGEKMDTKVVRMLKGALSPHINDYSLEVKYADASDDAQDSDFDLVERVRDSLKVNLKIDDAAAKPTTKKPISLFDSSADPDQEEAAAPDDTGEGRYAHLPGIAVPKIIQAPQNIPSLFAFNRTTVYLLLGPDAPKAKPTSIMLRGTSAHGPLELEIAVQSLEESGETIHQLAAKKAISELEQGRGWLPQAKDENNTDLKTRFEGRFDEMVEREAVRLGVQFQVGGKWCSFVAVESIKRKKEQQTEDWEFIEDEAKTHNNPSGSSWNTSGKLIKFLAFFLGLHLRSRVNNSPC